MSGALQALYFAKEKHRSNQRFNNNRKFWMHNWRRFTRNISNSPRCGDDRSENERAQDPGSHKHSRCLGMDAVKRTSDKSLTETLALFNRNWKEFLCWFMIVDKHGFTTTHWRSSSSRNTGCLRSDCRRR